MMVRIFIFGLGLFVYLAVLRGIFFFPSKSNCLSESLHSPIEL